MPQPQLEIYEEEDEQVESSISSLIFTFGIGYVYNGLRALIDLKLIRIGITGLSEDVLFPSPELVERVLNR